MGSALSLSVDKYLLLDALKKHHCHVSAMEIISVLLLRLSALSLSVDKYLLLDALKKHHCHVSAMEIISVLLQAECPVPIMRQIPAAGCPEETPLPCIGNGNNFCVAAQAECPVPIMRQE